MTKCDARDLRDFASEQEIEEAYYGSPLLPVRAGIIHALVSGNYDGKRLPSGWVTNFLLDICQELVGMTREMSGLNKALPYADLNAPHETTMSVIEQKNKWIIGSMRLRRVTSQCLLPAFSAYVGYRKHTFGGKSEVDKTAEKALALISGWDTVPHLELDRQPVSKAREKFLEVSELQYRYSRPNQLPEAWYRAVLFAEHFYMLVNYPDEVVLPQILKFLRGTAAQQGVKPSLSVLATNGSNRNVVRYLTDRLCHAGKLDDLIRLSS